MLPVDLKRDLNNFLIALTQSKNDLLASYSHNTSQN